jgi:uncharacterized protein YndB with AHSA1/START domain
MSQRYPGMVVRKEAWYPHPPSAVWIALTDPRAIAEWLMPNNFRAEIGAEFRMEVDPAPFCGDGVTLCKVLELEPERRLVYSWRTPETPGKKPCATTQVAWTLSPERGGTRLVLEHFGVEAIPLHQRLMMKFGWGTMVKRWIPKVAANVRDGRFSPGAFPLSKRCYKTSRISPEMVR